MSSMRCPRLTELPPATERHHCLALDCGEAFLAARLDGSLGPGNVAVKTLPTDQIGTS